MLIKTTHENFRKLNAPIVFGQDMRTYDVICEVKMNPSFEYEELNEDFNAFTQTCVPHVWDEDYQPTIAEVKVVKEKIDSIGESAQYVKTLAELNLMYQNIQLKEDLDTLALTILDLMEV